MDTSAGDFLQLTATDGKVVYKKTLGNWQNNVSIPLNDLPELKNGVYVLSLHTGGKYQFGKIDQTITTKKEFSSVTINPLIKLCPQT